MGGYKDFFIKNSTFIILFLIVLVAILVEPTSKWLIGADSASISQCPFEIEGNEEAELTVQYFTSPSCIYCWIEHFSLNKLVEERGNLFKLEKYDVRYCGKIARENRVAGTPSFVFKKGNSTEKVFGFRTKRDLEEIICGKEKC